MPFAGRLKEPTPIHTDLGALFVSLELSRSKWLITCFARAHSPAPKNFNPVLFR